MPEDNRLEALRLLVTEQSLEIRARREPEHIYTASLLGALGAVAWGVAAVSAIPAIAMTPFWRHPAFMGAIAAVLISVSVYRKIIREHGVYVELRKKQNEIVDEFFSLSGVKNESLPRGIQRNFQTDGPGYKGSLLIVRLSSVSVFLFCISVFLSSRDVIDFPHLSGSNQICANK